MVFVLRGQGKYYDGIKRGSDKQDLEKWIG